CNVFFFFFQAEDGIRDGHVTGVQTCALPIYLSTVQMSCHIDEEDRARVQTGRAVLVRVDAIPNRELNGTVAEISMMAKPDFRSRSEERRVGKECRAGRGPCELKKNIGVEEM